MNLQKIKKQLDNSKNKKKKRYFDLYSEDIDKIVINRKSFFTIFLRNHKVKLNKNDILKIDGQLVKTNEIFQSYLISHQWSLDKYNSSHFQILRFPINSIDIIINPKISNCFSNSIDYTYRNNKYKEPDFIEMELHTLFNIDDWKFTLMHEFSHFFKYLDIPELDNINKIIIIFYSTYKTILLLLFSLFITFVSFQAKDFFIFNSLLLLDFFLFYNLINYFQFLNNNIEEIYLKLYEEYLCDQEAFNLFNEIDLNNTFLNYDRIFLEENSITHPSKKNRIKFLKRNKLTNLNFIFTFTEYWNSEFDNFKIHKILNNVKKRLYPIIFNRGFKNAKKK